MARQPTAVHPHITATTPQSFATDPFWQSSPRYNRASMAALMRAIRQAAPPPPTAQRQRIPASPQATRRVGQCTHITMIRQHGRSTCNMCGTVPSVGWLYACRQDWLLAQQSPSGIEVELPQLPLETDDFHQLVDIATSLNMSSSVVEQMRSRSYTLAEAKRVISDKVHMLNVIKAEERDTAQHSPSASPHSKHRLDAESNIIASVGAKVPATILNKTDGAPADAPLTSTSHTAATSPETKQPKQDACNYSVCHTCRPFLHDRVPVTIAAVLSGTEPAISEAEMQFLRMIEPSVVSKLGTRPTPPRRLRQFGLGLGLPTSIDITSQQKDGADEDSTPSDRTSSDISSGFYEDDDNGDFADVDPFPCPGPGFCPVASYADGCAYDGDFDDGQRAINHGMLAAHHSDTAAGAEQATPDRRRYRLRHIDGNVSETPGRASSTGSSVSLPTPTTMPLTPVTPSDETFEDALNSRVTSEQAKTGKAATICGRLGTGERGNISSRHSSSSLGSEIAVADGVALTEEAVEAHIPDIKYEE